MFAVLFLNILNNMSKKSSVLYILLLLASRLTAQDGIATSTADTLKKNPLDEVVVTATRTDKKIEELPIPITTISAREIQNRGIVRLNEILAEQTGLALVGDHGTGVQMQGFDAQYTMILIDGEPLIGRTSGTLELSRITMANIDRIEIVKGPSSSLYGSEAMAGVINIITKTPPKGVSAGIATRYGTNQSADISVDGAYRSEKLTVSGLVNRFSNQGYSLMPESGFQTVAPFAAYTASGKVGYQFSDKTAFNVSLRYYDNSQDDRYGIEDRVVSGSGLQRDFSIFPSLTHRLAPKGYATQLSVGSLKRILEGASERDLDIMVFIGNRGCIQIHTGKTKKLLQTGPWFNVLDPEFNMHLRDDAIADVWLVKKPTEDGVVTSLEAFDADGNLIVQFFGKRKPRIPEREDWRQVVADYAILI